MKRPTRNDWVALVGVLLLLMSAPAHGYIDPGTGSLMLQAMVAGVLGALLGLKCYWRAIKQSVAKLVGRDGRGIRTDDDQ